MKFDELRVKDVRGVVRYVPRQMSWSARSRTDHIVGVKISGDAFHDLGYKSFHLVEGSVFFLNQRDDYDVCVLENGESLSIHFTTYEPIETDSFCVTPSGVGELMRILEKTEIQSGRYGLGHCVTLSLLYRFCGELAKLCEKPYSKKDLRMTDAIAYMNTHFREDDCLSGAVGVAAVSPRRFNDLFKAHFGVTPNRYLVLRRVDFAKELLESRSFSVSETAEICGFCDVYYFSRVFKNETGVPPREWKRGK